MNWLRQEQPDGAKYPDSKYIIETLYFNKEKTRYITVKQLLFGSYIYY